MVVDPEIMVHPLRQTLDEGEMAEILQAIIDDEAWLSLEEIEAAADYLYDHVAAERQTHPGSTLLH